MASRKVRWPACGDGSSEMPPWGKARKNFEERYKMKRPPPMRKSCKNQPGTWFNRNSIKTTIGPSVTNETKAAGKVLRQPFCKEREMRKILSGLGDNMEGKASPMPCKKSNNK
jgi:hypothetical protein